MSAVLLGLWALACGDRSDADRLVRLEPVLARLAAHRVVYVRDQDWCRGLAYARGHFVASEHLATCALAPGPYLSFDPVTEADRQAFFVALESTGLALVSAELAYDAAGSLVQAELALDETGLVGPAVSYVWAPGRPPQSIAKASRVEAVAEGWWRVTGDPL